MIHQITRKRFFYDASQNIESNTALYVKVRYKSDGVIARIIRTRFIIGFGHGTNIHVDRDIPTWIQFEASFTGNMCLIFPIQSSDVGSFWKGFAAHNDRSKKLSRLRLDI